MATPAHEKSFPTDEKKSLPRPFILRRLHSLLGVWLAVYLFQHLLVNSQAALYFEDDGSGFISAVNKIHDLPYLRAIEILFLGLPFFIHGAWGIAYALTSKMNSFPTSGKSPSLPQYKRNRAFSWQRITSWILVVGIIAHVIHMRFLEYPVHTQQGGLQSYMTRVKDDRSLPAAAEKLSVTLYTTEEIAALRTSLQKEIKSIDHPTPSEIDQIQEKEEWLEGAESLPLKKGELLAVSPNAGTAFFLVVRQAFKNPLMVVLYSILVVAAAYHGFNGLWTFMIVWGLTLTRRSQRAMRKVTTLLMWIVMLLGLMAAWGTYWTYLFSSGV